MTRNEEKAYLDEVYETGDETKAKGRYAEDGTYLGTLAGAAAHMGVVYHVFDVPEESKKNAHKFGKESWQFPVGSGGKWASITQEDNPTQPGTKFHHLGYHNTEDAGIRAAKSFIEQNHELLKNGWKKKN